MTTTAQPLEQPEKPASGIWWIASYPKSGSTWVRMFVNCAVTRFPVNINAAFQYASGDLGGYMYQSVASVPLADMTSGHAIYLRPAALINHLASRGGRDACLKTHNANITVDDIPLCPARITKGAVYIVRDPRDVAISFAKHMGRTIDEAIDLMGKGNTTIRSDDSPLFHFASSWSANVKSWMCQESGIATELIRYEDMLTDTEATFQRIVLALGLQHHVDDAAFQFALEQTTFASLQQAEQANGFRETGKKQDTFFNQGQAGNWKNVLTDDQVKRIEHDHGTVMQEVGYELAFEKIGA